MQLPFNTNPVEFLKSKHMGPNNFKQVRQVYKSQCRKPENLKEGMRKAHAELVSRGFMIKLIDLSEDIQQMISLAPFLHCHPYRIVLKNDSLSTPIRLVVDPTMSVKYFIS